MIESRVRFRHLQAFLEVARHKSVAKAAAILHVSQPAVTKTIRELEQALGVAVIERDGRGIRVSRMGEVFLRHAGMAVAAVKQGVDSVKQAGAGMRHPIRIGALPTVSTRVMPLAINLFLAEKTDAAIKIVTGENAVLLEQLRVGELDLVVGRLAAPEKMTGFFFEHLYSEQVVFVVRTGHPLLNPDQDLFARLGDFPVLMPTREFGHPSLRRSPFRHQRNDGFADRDRDRLRFVRPLFVGESDAVWIISAGVVTRELRSGAFVALPVDTDQTKGPVGLTMRTDTEPSAAFSILLQTIREAASRNA